MTVTTYAHNPAQMGIDVPRFLAQNVELNVAEDLSVGPMNFFRVEAAPLFDKMIQLARSGVTIYG